MKKKKLKKRIVKLEGRVLELQALLWDKEQDISTLVYDPDSFRGEQIKATKRLGDNIETQWWFGGGGYVTTSGIWQYVQDQSDKTSDNQEGHDHCSDDDQKEP